MEETIASTSLRTRQPVTWVVEQVDRALHKRLRVYYSTERVFTWTKGCRRTRTSSRAAPRRALGLPWNRRLRTCSTPGRGCRHPHTSWSFGASLQQHRWHKHDRRGTGPGMMTAKAKVSAQPLRGPAPSTHPEQIARFLRFTADLVDTPCGPPTPTASALMDLTEL